MKLSESRLINNFVGFYFPEIVSDFQIKVLSEFILIKYVKIYEICEKE